MYKRQITEREKLEKYIENLNKLAIVAEGIDHKENINEYRQLAEWLTELKERREAEEIAAVEFQSLLREVKSL